MAPTRAARATRLATSRLGIGLALAIQTAAILGSCTPGPPTPEPIARQYAAAWEKADYQTMWALLTDDATYRVPSNDQPQSDPKSALFIVEGTQ